MRPRGASRTVAAIAATILLFSTVGTCLARGTSPERHDCCKTRCHEGATPHLAACCCPTEGATDQRGRLPEVRAPLTGMITPRATPAAASPPDRTITPAPRTVDGRTLLLRRCLLQL